MMVPDERGHGSVQAQANGTIKWERRCHTICDFWERQRERKWSSVRHWAAADARGRGNSRCLVTVRLVGHLAGVEHCLHCLFVLLTNCWRAPLTNFGCPPRTKGNLRKIGMGSDSPHQNWEFGEGIPSPTKGAGIGNARDSSVQSNLIHF